MNYYFKINYLKNKNAIVYGQIISIAQFWNKMINTDQIRKIYANFSMHEVN